MDTHLDRIVQYCFTPVDREELAADWAKKQVVDHDPLTVHLDEDGVDLEALVH